MRRRWLVLAVPFLLFASCLRPTTLRAQAEDSIAQLRASFKQPPDDCRIMMRWWWFGPAVTKPELLRELQQMKAAGIGGVEIATLYALDLDHAKLHNLTYLSDEHLDNLRFAAEEARKLGLRVDITLGSGWPFGGPEIDIDHAAGMLRVVKGEIPPGAQTISAPAISTGESLIAAFLEPSAKAPAEKPRQLTQVGDHRLSVPDGLHGEHAVDFFISSRTGMMVKRPAVGAGGFVLDHYDREATSAHLKAVGDRLLKAFGTQPPYAVFSDSLEDDGSNWTPDLPEQFRRRRGYDILPHLPELVSDASPDAAAVRHDWSKTLTELATENFLQPMQAWAHDKHTLLRSQSYGTPPLTLAGNEHEDLPEGEGKGTLLMWRQFSDTRWAASAGHIFGHPVISSETWTWLHSPAFRATPLDMKAEADLHFLQGINQLVGHGWPYSPESAGEPGWRMYAAGAFNDHNPWSFVMPELTRYLQRVSFVLRQGRPANDVAILLPNDDAWASFSADVSTPASAAGANSDDAKNVSIDEWMAANLPPQLIPRVLDAGYNFDFVDADTIGKFGIPYPVLILPRVHRLPSKTLKQIADYASHGGIVIATGDIPAVAPGLLNASEETADIRQIAHQLFQTTSSAGHLIKDESELPDLLHRNLRPDLTLSPATPEIGFIHRKLPYGDIYFVANTSNRPHEVKASFRAAASHGEDWDPFTGVSSTIDHPSEIHLRLEPYESRVIFFSNSADRTAVAAPTRQEAFVKLPADLSKNWQVRTDGSGRAITMESLHSWSEDGSLRYYSGRLTYTHSVPISSSDLRQGERLLLDFGEGTPVSLPSPLPAFNMRAYLDPPIREAAEVFVNGESAGFVWHPPFRLDITRFLKAGDNQLRISVGNTAINTLAGQSLPDYRLLRAKYGNLFTPQDMQNLQPLPSGLLNAPKLLVADPGPAH